MWFKKKQTNQSNSDQSASRRTGDMRSELGLNGETHQAVRVRARQVQRDGLNETTAVYDEEVQLHDLKVRARRRLIGALVLLGASFVILPWVFDGQRKETAAQVAVAIPDKNVQFDVKNPKATDESLRAAAESTDKAAADGKTVDARATDAKASGATTTNTATAAVAGSSTDASSKPAATKQAVPSTVTTAPATTATAPTTAPTQQYAVHIGLVSDKKELDSLVARLRAAGVQPQLRTVTVDGSSKTRVRLGLFKTQAEAEAALAKVKGVAKNPVVIPIQQEQTKSKP